MNGAEDKQLTAIQHIHSDKNVFVWLRTAKSNFRRVLLGLHRASHPLWKSRSSVSPSTDFKTMVLHDAGVGYFTIYLDDTKM